MTAAARTDSPPAPRPAHLPTTATTMLEVVVPVLDEQAALEASVRRLHDYLLTHLPFTFHITVVDNGSTDGTPAVAQRLAEELPEVDVLRLEERGRGRALRAAWSRSTSPVLAYMDVDLSTDLAAVLPLVAPLVSGHSDVAIGTRLSHGSRVVRGRKREVISRCYNQILRRTLSTRFSDAQCGFKAIRADVAQHLLPLVEDTGWFFDTELLVLAERAGLRIHEVPVDWVDDEDSRVDVVATAAADLRGVLRVGRALAAGHLPLAAVRAELGRDPLPPAVPGVPSGMLGQLARFGLVGALSTVAYVLLFTALQPGAGAQLANLVALLVTALANTAANRRLTFGITGGGHVRHHTQGLLVLALALALTSGSLALLHLTTTAPSHALELAVVVTANAVATLLRFVLLRSWVFRPVPPTWRNS